mmetsp:Transcript_64077/g.169798  ORF Transcript_64077/g.169798 Transcript_64077/m.169798 type:complete len:187 (-) Transcript_64077:185-745(-)
MALSIPTCSANPDQVNPKQLRFATLSAAKKERLSKRLSAARLAGCLCGVAARSVVQDTGNAELRVFSRTLSQKQKEAARTHLSAASAALCCCIALPTLPKRAQAQENNTSEQQESELHEKTVDLTTQHSPTLSMTEPESEENPEPPAADASDDFFNWVWGTRDGSIDDGWNDYFLSCFSGRPDYQR